MQQRLALTLPAEKIARLAIHLQLTDVASDRGPAFDLSCIFVRKPPASKIAAIPLKPAARVFAVNPAFAAPHRKRLAGRNPEEVHPGVGTFQGRVCPREPTGWKLSLQSVRYFPPKTPRRSISGGVVAGGMPGQNYGQPVQRERTDSPAASGHSRGRFAVSPRQCPFPGANLEGHGWDGSTKPSANMPKNFQTCRILTNQGHVAEFSNDGTIIRSAPGTRICPP